jgi:hypothetical protein
MPPVSVGATKMGSVRFRYLRTTAGSRIPDRMGRRLEIDGYRNYFSCCIHGWKCNR